MAKRYCCCFTGHRNINPNDIDEITIKTRVAIVNLIENKNVFVFYNGVARGFDLLSAKIILDLKRIYPFIKLYSVIPYSNHASNWKNENLHDYKNVIAQSDFTKTIQTDYTKYCYQKRNMYMVDNCDFIISMFNGKPSGTKNTLQYAESKKTKSIINILDLI